MFRVRLAKPRLWESFDVPSLPLTPLSVRHTIDGDYTR